MSRERSVESLVEATSLDHLVFRIGLEDFAVSIDKIVEIRRDAPTTRVPRARPEIVGVMSVRGRLITVVDLRHRLRAKDVLCSHLDEKKRRILLVRGDGEEVGVRVDEVLCVTRFALDQIEAPHALLVEAPAYVLGIARPRDFAAGIVIVDLAALLDAA